MRGKPFLTHFLQHDILVNLHFLRNDKRCVRDFFTIDTIEHGLSSDNSKSILSLDNICLVLYTIFGKGVSKENASWSNQRDRISSKQPHLKEHMKMHRMVLSEICGIEF